MLSHFFNPSLGLSTSLYPFVFLRVSISISDSSYSPSILSFSVCLYLSQTVHICLPFCLSQYVLIYLRLFTYFLYFFVIQIWFYRSCVAAFNFVSSDIHFYCYFLFSRNHILIITFTFTFTLNFYFIVISPFNRQWYSYFHFYVYF